MLHRFQLWFSLCSSLPPLPVQESPSSFVASLLCCVVTLVFLSGQVTRQAAALVNNYGTYYFKRRHPLASFSLSSRILGCPPLILCPLADLFANFHFFVPIGLIELYHFYDPGSIQCNSQTAHNL